MSLALANLNGSTVDEPKFSPKGLHILDDVSSVLPNVWMSEYDCVCAIILILNLQLGSNSHHRCARVLCEDEELEYKASFDV